MLQANLIFHDIMQFPNPNPNPNINATPNATTTTPTVTSSIIIGRAELPEMLLPPFFEALSAVLLQHARDRKVHTPLPR